MLIYNKHNHTIAKASCCDLRYINFIPETNETRARNDVFPVPAGP